MHPVTDRILLDESSDAIIAFSAGLQVLRWSIGAEALYGYSRRQAIGRDLSDLIVPPEGRGAQSDILRRVLQGDAVTYEAVRRRQDGALRRVVATTKMVAQTPARLGFVLSSEKDVTALHAARQSGAIAEHLRDLLESLPDAILLIDRAGLIALANSRADELFGYDRGTLQGQSIEMLVPPHLREARREYRSNYFAGRHLPAKEGDPNLFGLHRNGTEFPIEISLSPVETDAGMLVCSAIRDVTGRKQFERILQDKNAELAQANQAKDRFLATVSHELRTPLNAILGFTGTLLMRLPGPLTDDQERQLRTVRTSARHLLALITDILDLAKIEAGKMLLVFEPTICQEVVREVTDTLRPEAERKGLQFCLSMPEADLAIRTDRRALTQILLNLLGNAIKFSEQGRIRVGLRSSEADGSHRAEIVVEDMGIGIKAADLERLFEAFVQLDTDRRQPVDGTGLGLHLSRRLADLLGGRILCRSEYRSGSTFTLELPRE
jgi:PAS domain S-box-containing protein